MYRHTTSAHTNLSRTDGVDEGADDDAADRVPAGRPSHQGRDDARTEAHAAEVTTETAANAQQKRAWRGTGRYSPPAAPAQTKHRPGPVQNRLHGQPVVTLVRMLGHLREGDHDQVPDDQSPAWKWRETVPSSSRQDESVHGWSELP